MKYDAPIKTVLAIFLLLSSKNPGSIEANHLLKDFQGHLGIIRDYLEHSEADLKSAGLRPS